MAQLIPIALGAPHLARRTGEFSLTDARYGAGQTLGAHVHQYPVLTFILAGQVQEACVSPRAVCQPMSLVIIPAGMPHAETFPAPGARCLIVEMRGDGGTRVHQHSQLFGRPGCVTGPRVASLGVQLHHEFRERDDLSSLAIEGIVLQLAAAAARARGDLPAGAPPAWLSKTRDLVHDSFRRPLSIVDLARDVGVHPVHLARAFGRRFGCSPAEYVRRLRVEAACDALVRSRQPLAEIAITSGFADQSHMNRQFRRRLGMTPGEFRRVATSDARPSIEAISPS